MLFNNKKRENLALKQRRFKKLHIITHPRSSSAPFLICLQLVWEQQCFSHIHCLIHFTPAHLFFISSCFLLLSLASSLNAGITVGRLCRRFEWEVQMQSWSSFFFPFYSGSTAYYSPLPISAGWIYCWAEKMGVDPLSFFYKQKLVHKRAKKGFPPSFLSSTWAGRFSRAFLNRNEGFWGSVVTV